MSSTELSPVGQRWVSSIHEEPCTVIEGYDAVGSTRKEEWKKYCKREAWNQSEGVCGEVGFTTEMMRFY